MDNMMAAVGQAQQAQQMAGFPFPVGGGSGEDGAFLAIIQQLLGQMAGGEADSALLAGILQGGETGEGGNLKPGEGLEMLQELAGTMMLNPALLMNLQQPDQEEIPVQADEVQAVQTPVMDQAQHELAAEAAIPSLTGDGLLPKEQKTADAAAAVPTAEPKEPLRESKPFAVNTHTAQRASRTADAEAAPLETAKESNTGEVPEQKNLLTAQSDFRSTIAQAKKQIAKQEPRPAEELMDVDALQAKVSGNRSAFLNTRVSEPAKTEDPPMLDQLKTGILEKLQNGDKEFVVKLKPESLGEITIRLLEKGGKTTLSIMTANSQTAKMISGELSALREAVKPMQVEVNEVIHQPEGQEALSQHFNMGQQFANEQHGQAFNRHQGGAWWAPEDEEAPAEFTQLLENQGLDTYV